MKYIFLTLLSIIMLTGCTTKLTNRDETPYDLLTNALLDKRLQIDVIKEKGGNNPCEPQEPYYRLSIKKRGLERYGSTDEIQTREIMEDSDIANGIVVIESTGKVEVMDLCLE